MPIRYRARVTLGGDPKGLHARPIAQVAQSIRGLDATIVLERDGQALTVNTRVPAFDLMRASYTLSLRKGATFEIACEGRHAAEALDRLRQAFTTGHFQGSEFQALDASREDAGGG